MDWQSRHTGTNLHACTWTTRGGERQFFLIQTLINYINSFFFYLVYNLEMDWQSRHTGTNLHVHGQQGEGKDNFFVFF